ncbi:hypothetical protein N7G274_005160 [Stereocaulon virgatum]|uniref:Uncharacterized protein n=1 Tax=Stereocaulon virgatum TaxID=373712 RepID=A0ABR4ABV2_9LECA
MCSTLHKESTEGPPPLRSPAVLDPTERAPFNSHLPQHHTALSQMQHQAPSNVPSHPPPIDKPSQDFMDADAQSLLPPYSPPASSYRGHNSEADYLAALRAWAEEKTFVQPDEKCALPGFYGKKTMEECIAKNPALRVGRKKGRKGSKGGNGDEGQGKEEIGKLEAEAEAVGGDGRRRKSSIGQWLSRKRTG